MASQKISQLTAITTVASGDYFPIVRASGTTNQRVEVGVLDVRYTLAASGVAAQSTANTALASGNAALASGNAALADLTSKVSKGGDIVSGTLIVDAQSFGVVSSVVTSGVILLDFSANNNFDVTLEGNSTLAPSVAPSGGQSGAIYLRQDGTGSRTLAYSGGWAFSNGSAPTLTTTASGTDLLAYYAAAPSTIVATLIAAVSGV
jgi:hypothetical protein